MINLSNPQELFEAAKRHEVMVCLKITDKDGMVVSVSTIQEPNHSNFWRETLTSLSSVKGVVSCHVQTNDGPHRGGVILKNFNVALFKDFEGTMYDIVPFYFNESGYKELTEVFHPVMFSYVWRDCESHPYMIGFHLSRIKEIYIKVESINFVPVLELIST